jgi:hypothetical protein
MGESQINFRGNDTPLEISTNENQFVTKIARAIRSGVTQHAYRQFTRSERVSCGRQADTASPRKIF